MEKPMQMQISMWIKSTTNRPANDIELSPKKKRVEYWFHAEEILGNLQILLQFKTMNLKWNKLKK